MDSIAGWREGWREGVVSNKKVKAASHSLGLSGSAWLGFKLFPLVKQEIQEREEQDGMLEDGTGQM